MSESVQTGHERLNPLERATLQKSILYKSGLIDNTLLTGPLSVDSKKFLKEVSEQIRKRLMPVPGKQESKPDTIKFLSDNGVLSPEDFKLRVIAPRGTDVRPVVDILVPPNDAFRERIQFLVEKGVLNTYTLWNFFTRSGLQHQPYANTFLSHHGIMNTEWEDLLASGMFDPKAINPVTLGLDAAEPNALAVDLLSPSGNFPRGWSSDKRVHPLVHKLRGHEDRRELSEQISAVIGDKPEGTILEQFRKVFEHYLTQTPLYEEVKKRDSIPVEQRENERAGNIALVNERQVDFITYSDYKPDFLDFRGYTGYDPHKRFLDIYARYGHGSMDPLQLAVIAATVDFYVHGGRSQLFSDVRVVPYKDTQSRDVPWIALAMCPGAKLLPVQGKDFISSMRGANRTFLTQSASTQANAMGSIPIIGTATASNRSKRDASESVLFRADFHKSDIYRTLTREDREIKRDFQHVMGEQSLEYKDVAGDFVGLINETLRVLMEVEKKEIERAKSKR